MKFILNKFPDDETFIPDERWTPLKEQPNLWIMQLQALPFAIINCVLIDLLLRLMNITFHFNLATMYIALLVIIPVHEPIHALFFPEGLNSNKIYFGFIVNGFAAFAAYIGAMKRNTLIRALLAPFLLISAAGFIYLLIWGSNNLIEHIIFFNAVSACVDCLGVYLLLRQVPADAVVKNKKIRTYWMQE